MLECLLNKLSRRKEYGVEDEEGKKFERGAAETEVGIECVIGGTIFLCYGNEKYIFVLMQCSQGWGCVALNHGAKCFVCGGTSFML